MSIIYKLLFLLAINVAVSSGYSVNCVYSMVDFTLIGNLYMCEGTILGDETSGNVSAITGNHTPGKNNGTVQAFRILSKNLKNFPKNVETFFPNVKAISLRDNGITTLINADLRANVNWEYLNLASNQITNLDSNLFDNLPNLKYVNFESNTIRHVGHDIKLSNTSQMTFKNNSCINVIATTAQEIENLRSQLLVQCPPLMYQIEQTLASRDNLLTQTSSIVQKLSGVYQDVNDTVECLTSEVEGIKDSVQSLDGYIQSTNESVENLRINIEGINSQVQNLSSDVCFISSDVEGLTGDLQGIKNNTQDLSRAVNDVSTNVQDLFSSIQSINSNFNNLTDNVSDINGTVEAIGSNVKDINDKVQNLEQSGMLTAQKVAVLEDIIDRLRKAVSNP